MTHSTGGTAQGRPDEAWTYVVEVPVELDRGTNLPYHSYDSQRTCCMYDASSPVHGEPEWVSVHITDDYQDAVRVAQDYEHVRVRSFKQAHVPVDHGIAPSVFTSKPSSAPDTPLVTRLCASHPEQRVRIPESAGQARCPTCHGIMVSMSMARAMGVKL